MIQTQPKNNAAPAPATTPHDVPVETRMARKMVELQFCGITVTADALASHGFTIKEINANWEAARDEAIIIERDAARAA